MIEYVTESGDRPSGAVIRAIGIGGGGCNAIDNLKKDGVQGVDFIASNSDVQALQKNTAEIKIQVGKNTAKGLGVGGNPEVGKKCVEESLEDIKKHLAGSDMVFISAGMGGGTGTGGSPQVAKIAKELGSLVVAVVTKPFKFEGGKKLEYAEKGIEELRNNVDAIIVVSNQKLLEEVEKGIPFPIATKKVDEVLINASKGIVDIIHKAGYFNIDFADIKNVMQGSGDALIGIGTAKGENRAVQATNNALKSPLLDGVTITGAMGVLINITADSNFSIDEMETVSNLIKEATGTDPYLKCGVVITEELTEEFTVTVLATKFEKLAEVKPIEVVEEVVAKAVEPTQQAPAPQAKPQNNNYQNDRNNNRRNNGRNSQFDANLPLQYPTQGSSRGSYNQPQPVNNPPFIAIDNNRVAAGTINNNTSGSRTAPRGNEELKGLDDPAYNRRTEPVAYASTGTYGVDPQPTFTAPQEEPARRVQERPVFLRRLMD